MVRRQITRTYRSDVVRVVNKEALVLKIIRDPFSPRGAQRTYREVVLLEALAHKNIIELRDVEVEDVVVLTFLYYPTDLRHAIIGDRLRPRERTVIAFQIFTALAYVHSARIVHRSVQPAHIFLDGDHAILGGFSSAQYLGENGPLAEDDDDDDDDTRPYCYRSMEELTGSSRGEGDIWAAGCVLLEMEIRVPVFPGATATEVLAAQVAALGVPSDGDDARLAAAVALNARSSTTQDTFRARVHAARAPGAEMSPDVDEYTYLQDEDRRRDDVADLAGSCLSSGTTASLAVLHPLFRSQVRLPTPSPGPLYDAIDARGGDILLHPRRRLEPFEYKKRLFDHAARSHSRRTYPILRKSPPPRAPGRRHARGRRRPHTIPPSSSI